MSASALLDRPGNRANGHDVAPRSCRQRDRAGPLRGVSVVGGQGEAAPCTSARQALGAIAEAYRHFAIQHPNLYLLTQSVPEPTSVSQQTEAARALQVLTAVVTSYGVPDDVLIHAVRLVQAGVHGFADLEARGGFQMRQSSNDSFRVLVDALDLSLSSFQRLLDDEPLLTLLIAAFRSFDPRNIDTLLLGERRDRIRPDANRPGARQPPAWSLLHQPCLCARTYLPSSTRQNGRQDGRLSLYRD